MTLPIYPLLLLFILLFRPRKSITSQYLILGCYSTKNELKSNLKKRLDVCINNYSNQEVIVSGGQGVDEDATEASIMQAYLLENKINKVILEEKSTSTFENFNYSKVFLKDTVVISNQYHMLRCYLIAKYFKINIKYNYCSNKKNHNNLFLEPFAIIKTIIFDLKFCRR